MHKGIDIVMQKCIIDDMESKNTTQTKGNEAMTNDSYTVIFNGTTWNESGLTLEAALELVASYDLNQCWDVPVALKRGETLIANISNTGIKWLPTN